MFSNAKRVSVVSTQTTPRKAAAKPVDAIDGWEQMCALDAASKALVSLVEVRKEALVSETFRDEFITRGCAAKHKPDSMHPVEGDGKGSAYIAKRSTRSALTQDELDLVAEIVGESVTDDDGKVVAIPGYTETIEAQPALLAVNPSYMHDEALLRKIDRALKGVKDIPEDFIIMTAPEQKVVVSDSATDNLFKLSRDKVASLFPVLCGVALRPVFGATLERAWEIIKPLIPEAAAAPKPSKGKPPVARKPDLRSMLEASLRSA